MTQAADDGLTGRWARFASELRYEDVPADAVGVVKGLILDTLGASLAASTLGDCCGEVARLVRANAGAPECTVLGYGDRVSILMGAFANGALAHALNFDALGGAGGHTGVAAVVAPLVMAERRGPVPGREFIAAVAVAAEYTARLAGALSAAGVDANEKFLEGQLLSYFGAAAGAARVLGFPPGRMHDVLGLALMQAAGTRQVSFEGGAAKAIYGAYTNHGAILAVMLAEQGIGARCKVIDGPAGIYSLFYNGRYDASTLLDGLGKNFLLLDTAFKPWATSGVLHPYIVACQKLRREHGLAPESIRAVQVRAAPHGKAWLEPVAERRRPHNAATAANSIFFAVAKTLVNGSVTLADFTPEGLAQKEPLELASRTGYTLDEKLGAGAAVEVTLHDGTTLEAIETGERAPLGYDQLAEKFRDCARYAARPVPANVVERVVDRIANLEALQDVAELPALLGGGG